MRRRVPSGFTLVELLVVIAIIGVLIAMLLPAVEGAREASRRSTCGNNLHQLGLGCLQHESAQGFLPTDGWAYYTVGDPDRGFGGRQPGGWQYNILPYIDLQQLHDMSKLGTYSNYLGAVVTAANKSQAVIPAAGMPILMFNCQTRRKLMAFPEHYANDFLNMAGNNPTMGRSDYAGCGGSNYTGVGGGPPTLAGGDNTTDIGNHAQYQSDANPGDWSQYAGTRWDYTSGVFFRHSTTKMASIRHGVACTYLLGERNVCPDDYYTGIPFDDDQGWDQGYDYDTIRWTGQGWYDGSGNPTQGSYIQPMRDTPGVDGGVAFGSAHADGFSMVTCDGAVHKISYTIDPDAHRRYGDCRDKTPVDLAPFGAH